MICVQGKLSKALVDPIEALLEAAGDDTWPAIRNLFHKETDSILSEFSSAVSGFDLDQSTIDNMMSNLKDYARNVVESKSREEAGRVLIRMKDR